jgi:hypothetical protein
MRTPTWQEVEEFLRIDGWVLVRRTGHTFYRKVRPDGTALRTHTSFAGDKTMSASRFALILRAQLGVTAEEFWEALRTGRPVPRPGEVPAEAPPLRAWVATALKFQFSKTDEEIAAMNPDEAARYVLDEWSKPRP